MIFLSYGDLTHGNNTKCALRIKLNYVQSSFPYKSDFYVDIILCNDCFCEYKRARINWWLKWLIFTSFRERSQMNTKMNNANVSG